jgi:outer membrane protein assembly factor BamB
MIPRRFINLMMKDLRVGGSYWLSRMSPEKNLFYASVGEAVESATRMPLYASASELSSPKFRFKSSRALDSTFAFMPFYGVDAGPSEGRIVVSDSAGHTHLYDAEEGSGEMLPPTNESSNWHSPISMCVAKANAIRADALYAINARNSTNFKSLAYRKDDDTNTMAWDWLELPPPPYVSGKEDPTIQSYTLLQDKRTICFSSLTVGGGFGTYCFDTDSLEWTKAGSWMLPFVGHALCVPQLHNLYFGFHDSNDESLVAVELP